MGRTIGDKWTKEQLTCPECGFVAKDMRGLNGHRMFKHGVHPSVPQLPLEKQDLLVTDTKLARLLDERFAVISGQIDGLTGSINELNEQLVLEQEQREGSVVLLDERLAAAEAKTIADFPAEEKAEFLISSLRRFAEDGDALAKISKATDLKISSRSEAEADDKMLEEVERLLKADKAEKDKQPDIVKGRRTAPGWKFLESLDLSYRTDGEKKTPIQSKETKKPQAIPKSKPKAAIEPAKQPTGQPTNETERFKLGDGRYHTFRVYKGAGGMARPELITNDLVLGQKYIDLSKPLD